MDNGIEAAVTGVTPNQAMAGQLVTVSGTGLDGTNAVSFGAVASHSFSAGSNAVLAVVPRGVHPGSVTITLAQQSGASVSSGPIQIMPGSVPPAAIPKPAGVSTKVVHAPLINTFSPSAAPVGSHVLIGGMHLGGATWVKFGGVLARVTRSSGTTIVAIVPKRAHSGKITVHTRSGGTSVSAQRFLVTKR
jgi:hypothetical protein